MGFESEAMKYQTHLFDLECDISLLSLVDRYWCSTQTGLYFHINRIYLWGIISAHRLPPWEEPQLYVWSVKTCKCENKGGYI